MFKKELVLIKQIHQKSMIFVINDISQIKMYEPYLCNIFDLMQKVANFNDVAIVSLKGSDPRIHFWYMIKDDAINVMNNIDLTEKSGSL